MEQKSTPHLIHLYRLERTSDSWEIRSSVSSVLSPLFTERFLKEFPSVKSR